VSSTGRAAEQRTGESRAIIANNLTGDLNMNSPFEERYINAVNDASKSTAKQARHYEARLLCKMREVFPLNLRHNLDLYSYSKNIVGI
jgi:hypothetical protein